MKPFHCFYCKKVFMSLGYVIQHNVEYPKGACLKIIKQKV
jgi:hypothetical protein